MTWSPPARYRPKPHLGSCRTEQPVTLEGDLEAMALAHQLCSEMLQRVDGKRSIDQVAAELAAKFDLPAEEMKGLALRCLGNIVQANQRNPMPGKR
ncbi:MAG: hypothetical protein ACKVPX_11225 [Myxococcaceae bacterium]